MVHTVKAAKEGGSREGGRVWAADGGVLGGREGDLTCHRHFVDQD